MSDYVSELDTSDNEARTFHRGQMVRAALLIGKGEGELIFERIRPEFRSEEVRSAIQCRKTWYLLIFQYNFAISRADEIIEEREVNSRKRKVAARRVDLGRSHNHIPKIAPYPFMVNEEWKKSCIDVQQLDRSFRTRAEDPAGYGKKKGIIGQR